MSAADPSAVAAAIAALQAQRALLGDAVVDASVAALRAQLAAAVPAAEPEPALRQVSILFLDLVGSTRLSQHLDPEATGAVIDGAMARCSDVVTAHGGRVLQYAGDSVLAVFGADGAREDDAERAVLCGLALLAVGRELGAQVLAAHGHAGLDLRVGVHTGGVMLWAGVDAERSIRGVAVHIAARMEQTAPPGALRISQDTFAQVRGMFEVEAQPPLEVKGVDRPLQTWLVRRAKARAFRTGTRGIEGVATRMVGREAERAALESAFLGLFAGQPAEVLTVVAEAGIGKSRLLYEFETWSDARPERFVLFRGRATPVTHTQPFGLLRDLFAWRFGLQDDEGAEAARRRLEDGVVPLFEPDEGADAARAQAHLLGHLIGIDGTGSRHVEGILGDARQLHQRGTRAAAQVIRRLGLRRGIPVVLQLDDLHWADGESLDFLAALVAEPEGPPMLLLGFTRPTLFERHPGWPGHGVSHRRLDLHPLGPDDSRRLVDELLKPLPAVPESLREMLTDRAEGNPFYLEELVRMLIDQGAIVPGASWSLDARRLQSAPVPPTLTGVLQARLDSLPPAERRALQQASVVGAVFWDRALAAVETQAPDQLPALVRRELTLPRADAPIEGLREFAFRHQILHQVTYDTVLRHHRQEGHARVARWLAGLDAQGSARAGDLAALAADHFERAGDAWGAAESHARAAEHAAQRMAHERVLLHAARGLELLQDRDPESTDVRELRWRLLLARSFTADVLGQRELQARDLEAMEQVAAALDDPARRARVALRQANRAMRMADWDGRERAALRARDWAAQAGRHDLRLDAVRQLATQRLRQQDIEGGRALARQGIAEARALGLRRNEGQLLNVLAIAASMQGHLAELPALNRQALAIFRETGNRVNEAILQKNLGSNWLRLGDLDQASRDLEAALQLLRSNGDRTMESTALSSLSQLALWQGDAARARDLALQALALARTTQARASETTAGQALGDAELALGLVAEARCAYQQTLALALDIEAPDRHDARAGLARVALAEGAIAAALASVQPLRDDLAAGATIEDALDVRLVEWTVHEVLTRAGDPEADHWLERAHAGLDRTARTLGEPELRAGFLERIPHHRRIVAAWAARGAAPAAARSAAPSARGQDPALTEAAGGRVSPPAAPP